MSEMLTDEQLYHVDLVLYRQMLTDEEEQTLVMAARAGDAEARELIVLFLLPRLRRVARKYAVLCQMNGRKRIEYLDLVQVGSLTLVERLEKALAHPCPFGYLQRAVSGEIVRYCQKYASLVVSPSKRGGDILPPLEVTSVDVVLPGTEKQTLLDVLPTPAAPAVQEKDFSLLHEAVDALPARQREVVVRHYGFECAPDDLFTISCDFRAAKGQPFSENANLAYGSHQQALKNLRKKLELVSAVA